MNPVCADPVLSCSDAKALEARLFGGDEELEWAAMERAGAGVAAAVLEDFKEIGGFPAAGRVLVLAGKGHNGGDALLAASAILATHPGASADVVFVFGERALRPLAARAWRKLAGAAPRRVRSFDGIRQAAGAQPCPHPLAPANRRISHDLCLDGIFGFQFRPPVDEAAAGVLRAVNALEGIRLRAAVDLPSAIGGSPGDPVFRADFTYATGIVKAPLLDDSSREAAGRLRYVDLGFFRTAEGSVPTAGDAPGESPAEAIPAAGNDFVFKPSVLAPLAALRAAGADKRAFGHLFVIGGSRSYPGAALMCVRAALRSGAGLVTAFVPKSFAPAFAARAPEAIWMGWPETPGGGLALEGLHLLQARLAQATAMVMGCGFGAEPETQVLACEIVKLAGVPVVLDADALQPPVLAAATGKRAICLPHAGEFKRLAGGRDAGAAALRALADETGATIVLKGPVTRIAGSAVLQPALEESGLKPRSPIYHSFFGGPVLARGGSGDLLAGLVGGLLAQAPGDPLLAACRGVVWHGMAADLLARDRGQVAVQATQLLDYLPSALRLPAC